MTEIKSFKPLSKEDVAGILGVTIRTLENHVTAGILPAPAALGGRRYWHPDIFYAWLDEHLRIQCSPTQNTASDGDEARKNCGAVSKIRPDRVHELQGPTSKGESLSKRAHARDQRRLLALEEGI